MNMLKPQDSNNPAGEEKPAYVYHGTVAGRLRSIYEHGLIPGKVPVWKGQGEQDQLIRSISDAAVFFSLTWSNALGTWAFIAHKCSRGPKASIKRAPAVIRLSTKNLHLERDPAALNPSWMVRGTVPVPGAEVIIGFDTLRPVWRPLGEVIHELG